MTFKLHNQSGTCVSNLLYLLDCTCDPRGAEDGNICSHKSNGQCRCYPQVMGPKCDTCIDGFWDLNANTTLGCRGTKPNFDWYCNGYLMGICIILYFLKS